MEAPSTYSKMAKYCWGDGSLYRGTWIHPSGCIACAGLLAIPKGIFSSQTDTDMAQAGSLVHLCFSETPCSF